MKPAEMMERMMSGAGSPMEMCMRMCRQMAESVERASERAAWATPELRGLFESWLAEIEGELLERIRSQPGLSATQAAGMLGITPESVAFLMARLARSGRIELLAHPREAGEKASGS